MKQKDFLGRRAIGVTALGAALMLVLAGCSAGGTGQAAS